VGTERIDQEFGVPDRYGTMGKCSASNLSSKRALQSTNLVFEILGLLTQSTAFALCWAHGLDSVANALDLVGKAVTDHREVWRQSAIVINQQDVLEAFSGVASNVLSDTVFITGKSVSCMNNLALHIFHTYILLPTGLHTWLTPYC